MILHKITINLYYIKYNSSIIKQFVFSLYLTKHYYMRVENSPKEMKSKKPSIYKQLCCYIVFVYNMFKRKLQKIYQGKKLFFCATKYNFLCEHYIVDFWLYFMKKYKAIIIFNVVQQMERVQERLEWSAKLKAHVQIHNICSIQ